MRAAVSTVERTDVTPARCPAMRGKCRRARPAAVAVHDDGDVFWEPFRIKPLINFRFLAIQPGRNRRLQANLCCFMKLT